MRCSEVFGNCHNEHECDFTHPVVDCFACDIFSSVIQYYFVIFDIGHFTLVGPMKLLSSVCLSICPSFCLPVCPSVCASVHLPQNFLKIRSLVFSDIVHDDS